MWRKLVSKPMVWNTSEVVSIRKKATAGHGAERGSRTAWIG